MGSKAKECTGVCPTFSRAHRVYVNLPPIFFKLKATTGTCSLGWRKGLRTGKRYHFLCQPFFLSKFPFQAIFHYVEKMIRGCVSFPLQQRKTPFEILKGKAADRARVILFPDYSSQWWLCNLKKKSQGENYTGPHDVIYSLAVRYFSSIRPDEICLRCIGWLGDINKYFPFNRTDGFVPKWSNWKFTLEIMPSKSCLYRGRQPWHGMAT